MPTRTFFNLSEEKRRKLLLAARREFARAPFPDASINQIIQSAGIPRGSFYMYFSDKADLFFYLVQLYFQRLLTLMERFLDQRAGDPFAAFLDLFDLVAGYTRDCPSSEIIQDILNIVKQNAGFNLEELSKHLDPDDFPHRLSRCVDSTRLSTQCREHLDDMFHILCTVSFPLIANLLQTEDPAPARARYVNRLSILRRGMEAAEPALPLLP
jgi:AcrR family transcriptional regulator